MKRFTLISNNRAVLLPVIMTVSILLIALGMRPPTLPDHVKPRQHNRAVVEAQVKIAKADQGKAQQDCFSVVLTPAAEIAAPQTFHTRFTPSAAPVAYRAAVSQFPSRAPPISAWA